jgi:hypothetical protein
MQRKTTSLTIIPNFISDADAKDIVDLAIKSDDKFNFEITKDGKQISTADNAVGKMGWEEAPTKLRNGSPYYVPSFSENPKPTKNNGFTINYREDTELWALTDRHVALVAKQISTMFDIEELELMATIFRRGKTGATMPPHQDGPVLNGNQLVNIDFSCFMFLNEDFEGGSIHFEELGVSWQPICGSAVILSNTSTKSMVHEIKPVTKGERFSINAFFRIL